MKTRKKANKWEKWRGIQLIISPTDTLMHYCYNYSQMSQKNLYTFSPHSTLVHFSGHESWTATFPTGFMFVWRICFRFQVLLRFLKYQACLVTRNSCHSLLALTCTWRKQVFKCRVWKQCHFQAPSRALMFRFQLEMYPRALLFRSSGAKLPRGQGPACGAHGECGALVLPPNV